MLLDRWAGKKITSFALKLARKTGGSWHGVNLPGAGGLHLVVDDDGLDLTARSEPWGGANVVVGQNKKYGAHLPVEIIEWRAEAVRMPVK